MFLRSVGRPHAPNARSLLRSVYTSTSTSTNNRPLTSALASTRLPVPRTLSSSSGEIRSSPHLSRPLNTTASTSASARESAEDASESDPAAATTGTITAPTTEHAVISSFDLFSIGVGPSSSHTVGPMRAGKIFVTDLANLGLLEKVRQLKVTLYGSLAATGKGHHTPQAILLGFEGSDPETIDTGTIPSRYDGILENKTLLLQGKYRINYDMDRDMLWRWDQVLPTHPNGMRFSAFDEQGDLLATNEYFSVGGGFVVNERTQVDENLFYKGVDKSRVHEARLTQSTADIDVEVNADADGAQGKGAKASAATSEPTPEDKSKNGEAPPPGSSTIGPSVPYPFTSGASLLALTRKHNMTIAQIVYDNERSFGYTDDDIHTRIMRIWNTMDECIRTGVSTTETTLPGRLKLRRRAPALYRRLMRGFYPGIAHQMHAPLLTEGSMPVAHVDGPVVMPDPSTATHARASLAPDSATSVAGQREPGLSADHFESQPVQKRVSSFRTSRAPRVVGQMDHELLPMPPRKTVFKDVDFLSAYAIAVNEVNAAGGRIVTSPTNGAAGVIPAVLKYIIEFVTDDPEKAITTFLLTAAAVGMLFKRGSTISAAEGGCQAEVGVACSMAAAGFAACMGAAPETILQAAEIGIEHNLGLTCDPVDGLVQVPCIERNSLGAVKALTAAQLAMASDGVYSVTLDEAIAAMRLTANEMSHKFKETSMSGLATTAGKIPLTVPAC